MTLNSYVNDEQVPFTSVWQTTLRILFAERVNAKLGW